MSRHAYLIIAHTDQYCLTRLLECLDDVRNDIYLLIDKKSQLQIDFQPQFSQLYTLKRRKIYWADISQVQAELRLLEAATGNSKYTYYHLLSGQDLPIKTQDYIHNYFISLPVGQNLLGFYETAESRLLLKERISYRAFFTKYLRNRSLKGSVLRKLSNLIWWLQVKCGLKRQFKNIEFKKGANWFSITDDFAHYILSKKTWILKTFSHVVSADELVLQTIVWNSHYQSSIHSIKDEYEGCMREIDWNRGTPYVWKHNDYKTLLKSNKLFARKFDSYIDKHIIDSIVKQVLSHESSVSKS